MERSNAMLSQDEHFATNATHVGAEPEQWSCRSVVPHIVLSTTFKQSGPGEHLGFEYGRSGNPTRDGLEKCLASLEGAEHSMVFSSGLAATTTVLTMFKTGDHIIATDDLYGGTNR
ncbi:unnamed protein product [Cyprideis torosa]|uniref:cystathionine gamma-lyase n=2 Tax=Cyprideis torosa TaxID=163714 RepID=A0A7R8WJ88_9CRUS|nr:unnamed protein product [Cyprideis torosa]CAG0894952.1 unnamed protein product [Cyprideis torosa]